MRLKMLLSTVFAFALMLFAAGASADPIGPNCGTCQGSIYTLSYSGSALPDADPLHQTFRIFLTIDTSGYNGGGSFLDDVSVKVVDTSHFVSSSLFDAPGGTALWTLHNGGINAGGCQDNGAGFVCTDFTGPPAGLAIGPTYNWAFDITVDNGSLFTGLLESSIKARYVNADDVKVGDLVSENISLQSCATPPCTHQETPEPATLGLLAIALLGMGVALRRRRS